MNILNSSSADQWSKWCPLFGKLSIFEQPSNISSTTSMIISRCIDLIKEARNIWGRPVGEYETSLPKYAEIINYPVRKIIAARAMRFVLVREPKLIVNRNFEGHNIFQFMAERLREFSKINKSCNFISEEFRAPLTTERLCKEIINDGYKLNIKSPVNSLAWLNEVLKTSNFYDVLCATRTCNFTQDIKDLANKTKDYRNKSVSDLTDDEKRDIEILNRFLLETIYPNDTPKILFVSDSEIFALITIHLAFNVGFLVLVTGKSVEDPSVEGQLIGASESLMLAKQFRKPSQGQQQTKQESPHDKAKQAEFITPPGAKWNEVKISFIDNQNVSISIRGKTVRKNYAEMGFKDMRTNKPVKSWAILLDFSEKECLSFSQNIKDKTEKGIQDLRKRLKAYFNIQDDPITLERGYRPIFEVCMSERDGRSVIAYSNSHVFDEKEDD